MNVASYRSTLPVQLLRTRNEDGVSCYFVIRSDKLHSRQLLAKRGREQVNIDEYGEILASGYGSQPSTHILTMLKTRYGVELGDYDA